MTNTEFSNQFDLMLSSYKHNKLFGEASSQIDIALNEYDKSVYLTQAQDNIIKSYFNVAMDLLKEGFDGSIQKQLDFNNLVEIRTFTLDDTVPAPAYSQYGIVFDFSRLNALFILNEKIIALRKGEKGPRTYVIKPIHYKEYDRIMSQPYNQPMKRQAWRLYGKDVHSINGNAEIVIRKNAGFLVEYKVRYIRKPKPIVLINLTDEYNDLSINGVTEETSCELDDRIHMDILNEAVRLALIANGVQSKDAQVATQNSNSK